MVENSGVPTALTGPTVIWEYTNPEFEKFFGFKREDVLGKNTLELPLPSQ
ncbi:MAG: PAS domain S-box protein [Candidatus Methanolliviera hydrocarbonicum]|uniref:PAS domain S-box protein n=1 Tax=Candidatus Methanolliviera hydrocarbonicum TaxID=2491085 RepID=A0A520KYF1_9EURY|nr:MAG: PAS domain S-box protein [Candidatus Methanolliviera hydrocarbonicum]